MYPHAIGTLPFPLSHPVIIAKKTERERENKSENIAFSLIVATHVCNLSAKLYEGVLAVRNLLTPEAKM